MAIVNKIESNENDLRQLDSEESNIQNHIAPTTYTDGNIMSALRKFTPIELQSIDPNLPLDDRSSPSEKAEYISLQLISNDFLEANNPFVSLESDDSFLLSNSSELMGQIVQSRSFSNEDLVSLAVNTNISNQGGLNSTIEDEDSISHLNYGCCCFGCQGTSGSLLRDDSVNIDDRPSSLATNSTNASGIYYIDALIPPGAPRWNNTPLGSPTTVTYSFMTSVPSYDSEPRPGFVAFDAVQRNSARQTLQLWSDVSGITFVETSNGLGQIQFGTYDFDGAAFSVGYPNTNGTAGDIWLSNSYEPNSDQTPGSYGFMTMIHEIGHSLGLKHPGNYNYPNYDPSQINNPGPYLPLAEDNYQYSLMSYNGNYPLGSPVDGVSYNGSSADPSTPQLYDVAAIQYLYGANYNTRTGNNFYSWAANEAFVQTIWDAGGIDTISAANQIVDAKINLNTGSFSSIGPRQKNDNTPESATDNLAIAFNVTIENAQGGSGNDTLTGNLVANHLSGGNGDDTLYGGEGGDTLVGGEGKDTFYIESGNDTYEGGGGIDRLSLSGDYYTLSNGALKGLGFEVDTLKDAIEQIEFTGFNGESIINAAFYTQGSVKIVGMAGNDKLYGGSGDDVINGAGYTDQGSWTDMDTIDGGAGKDYLIGDSDSLSGLNFSSDTIHGGTGDDTIEGGRDKDYLYGDADNDILNGGSGDDIIDGGTGIDTVVDFGFTSATLTDDRLYNDTLTSIEKANLTGSSSDNTVSAYLFSGNLTFFGKDGNDTVFGSIGSMTAFGDGGNDNIKGNVGNDAINGGDGNDLLYGEAGIDNLSGGEGNDTLDGGIAGDNLIGGGGNDDYYVDNLNDAVVESSEAIAEIDTIHTSIDYSLPNNVENLVLIGALGTNAANGQGNSLNNSLTGNHLNNNLYGGEGDDTIDGGVGDDTLFGDFGNDTLSGGEGNDTLDGGVDGDYLDGGVGDDTMRGGIGNDTYIVDSVGDKVIESGVAEDPIPFPSSIAAIPEFDRVYASVNHTLSDNVEALNLQGKGNFTGTGNYLDNTLTGADGNDTLIGAAGKDILVGGAGDDSLVGGTDSDLFTFTGDSPFTRFGKTLVDPKMGVDRIEDFERGDSIVLDKTVFSGLQSIAGIGFSVATEFTVVSSDLEVATSRGLIVYSKETGNLFYNQNSTNPDFGSGGMFATVVGAPDLIVQDFILQA